MLKYFLKFVNMYFFLMRQFDELGKIILHIENGLVDLVIYSDLSISIFSLNSYPLIIIIFK